MHYAVDSLKSGRFGRSELDLMVSAFRDMRKTFCVEFLFKFFEEDGYTYLSATQQKHRGTRDDMLLRTECQEYFKKNTFISGRDAPENKQKLMVIYSKVKATLSDIEMSIARIMEKIKEYSGQG